MKRIVKILGLSVLFALLTVGICTSCVKKENNAPDGMMIVSAKGADYLLYAPTTWNRNTMYGISGAYRNVSEQSTVSVNRFSSEGFSAAEGADRNAEYWETVYRPMICELVLNGNLTSYPDDDYATVLGGMNAVYRHVSGIVDGKQTHFVRVIAERNSFFYVFAFTSSETLYESCLNDVKKMTDTFEFTDTAYIPEDYEWAPSEVEAPSGMQVASSDEVSYRLFVPSDWVVDYDNRIFSAYEPNDRTNISVVPYLPDTGTSVDDYFAMMAEQMKEAVGEDSFTLLSEGVETELGTRPAKQYEFRLTLDGKVYCYRQLIALHKGMFYTMTYTSSETHYDEHLNTLDAVASAFVFR